MNGTFEEQMNVLPKFRRIPVRWNGRVFLASILAGFVAHAYCMLNLVGTEDTIGEYSEASVNLLSTFAGASTGRWLSGAANWIQTWYRTPWVAGMLIILVIALLGQIVIDFLNIQSTAGFSLGS